MDPKSTESPQNTTINANDDPLPFNLTDVDRATLAQTDEEFIHHSWEELKDIVGANDLSAFKRYPSQLRRYLSWSSEIKAAYGNIPNFVCAERLHWVPSRVQPNDKGSGVEPQNHTPFAHRADYKILRNDWPYATPRDVSHLVIWLKTRFAISKPEGHLLPEGRTQIEAFVDRTFAKPLEVIYGKNGRDRVLWFKNWSALQSVGSLEHFHCFIRGAEEELLKEWTGEDKRSTM